MLLVLNDDLCLFYLLRLILTLSDNLVYFIINNFLGIKRDFRHIVLWQLINFNLFLIIFIVILICT